MFRPDYRNSPFRLLSRWPPDIFLFNGKGIALELYVRADYCPQELEKSGKLLD